MSELLACHNDKQHTNIPGSHPNTSTSSLQVHRGKKNAQKGPGHQGEDKKWRERHYSKQGSTYIHAPLTWALLMPVPFTVAVISIMVLQSLPVSRTPEIGTRPAPPGVAMPHAGFTSAAPCQIPHFQPGETLCPPQDGGLHSMPADGSVPKKKKKASASLAAT